MTQDKDTWRKQAEKELRGRRLDDLTWNTLEGIPVSPLYTADDVSGLDQLNTMPGIEPLPAVCVQQCTQGVLGPSVNTQVFPRPRNQTPFIVVPWPQVSRGFPLHLIWRHTVDTTVIMNA